LRASARKGRPAASEGFAGCGIREREMGRLGLKRKGEVERGFLF
jgi:hypothetical protein